MKRSPQRKAALRRTASTSARLHDRNRKQRRNFFLERLEDRSLMAQILLSGLGAGHKMHTPASGLGNAVPQQDDSLVFQAGAARLGTQANPLNNDLAAGTRYRSITISYGYTIGGTKSNTLIDGVTFNSAGAAATVSVPLTLSASASIFSANVGGKLTLSGTWKLGCHTVHV